MSVSLNKRPVVTSRQAGQVLSAVRRAYPDFDFGDGPRFVPDWDGRNVIIWEEGAPYSWTLDFAGNVQFAADAAAIFERVYVEPVNECVLALYPA